MTFRQVLQIEIWSKRTTRRFFFGFIVVVIAFLLFVPLDRFWITPVEKKAGREALASIEAVQTSSDYQSDVLDKRARANVEAAWQKSFTLRDRQVAFALSSCLRHVEFERLYQKRLSSSNELERKLAGNEDPKVKQILGTFYEKLGGNVHRALD